VATTGFSWLRLLGIRKVSAAWPDAPNRGLVTGLASVECAIAGILALGTIFATAGPLPMAMPSVALPTWILAATVTTITARRLTVDVVTSAGGGTGRGVFETVGSTGLLLGGIATAGGRATAWALGTGAANAGIAAFLAVLSLAGGLVLAASALAIWFSTSRLAEEFPSLPRFRPRRGPAIGGGLPARPESAPLEVAPPRPVAEREPIELEPPTLPTLPKARPEEATREIPEKPEAGDDDFWNGWKR
jgi:hypothetical protein